MISPNIIGLYVIFHDLNIFPTVLTVLHGVNINVALLPHRRRL